MAKLGLESETDGKTDEKDTPARPIEPEPEKKKPSNTRKLTKGRKKQERNDADNSVKAQSNKRHSDKHPKTKPAAYKVERRPRVELDDESEEDDDSLVAKIEVVNNKLDVLNKKKEADDKPAPKPASKEVKKSKPKHTKKIKKLVAAIVPHKKRSSVEIL